MVPRRWRSQLRRRPLGPFAVDVAAPVEVVFDVAAAPYAVRTPQALREKLSVIWRGETAVIAEHYTPVWRGRFTATTVELVTFERPSRIGFRLLRGPVARVEESFDFQPVDGSTRLTYSGTLGATLGPLSGWWATLSARKWESVVRATFGEIKAEAERRARVRASS